MRLPTNLESRIESNRGAIVIGPAQMPAIPGIAISGLGPCIDLGHHRTGLGLRLGYNGMSRLTAERRVIRAGVPNRRVPGGSSNHGSEPLQYQAQAASAEQEPQGLDRCHDGEVAAALRRRCEEIREVIAAERNPIPTPAIVHVTIGDVTITTSDHTE